MSYLTRKEFTDHLRVMEDAPVLIIDTEGTLTHPYSETWGISYYDAYRSEQSEYFAFRHHFGENLPTAWEDDIRQVISEHSVTVYHHAKHDLKALRNMGIEIKKKFYCTQQMAHFVNENLPAKNLDWLGKHYTGMEKNMPPEIARMAEQFGWKYIPVDIMRPYATNDAVVTGELFKKLIGPFREEGFEDSPFRINGVPFPSPWEVEQDWIRVIGKIEDAGLCIDEDTARSELTTGLQRMKEIKAELGFDPAKSTELGRFLLDELKLPPIYNPKAKTNKPTFNKAAMEIYDELLEVRDDHRAKLILEFRGWSKSTSSNYKPYLEKLSPVDKRLRCSYKLFGTHTGRMSCENPNMQQIPKISSKPWNGKLKTCITAPEGFTAWEADYSQLEFRLGTAYGASYKDAKELGKVKELLDAFNDDSRDVFTEMSDTLGMTRDEMKTMVYSIQYGAGVNRISTVFGISDAAARARINQFFTEYRGLKLRTKEAAKKCREQGFLKYWSGRRRHFDRPKDMAHKAFNSVIQGGAFEIVKHAMIKMDKAGLNNADCYMDLQVHDSVRFCIRNGMEDFYLPKIKAIMEDVQPNFGVRFKVEIKKWGTKEVWELAA